MKHFSTVLIVLAGATMLSSCATTGNPREGGIFWSESKAQRRLAERQNSLDAIDRDTDRVDRRNSNLESAVERRRRMLGE